MLLLQGQSGDSNGFEGWRLHCRRSYMVASRNVLKDGRSV